MLVWELTLRNTCNTHNTRDTRENTCAHIRNGETVWCSLKSTQWDIANYLSTICRGGKRRKIAYGRENEKVQRTKWTLIWLLLYWMEMQSTKRMKILFLLDILLCVPFFMLAIQRYLIREYISVIIWANNYPLRTSYTKQQVWSVTRNKCMYIHTYVCIYTCV